MATEAEINAVVDAIVAAFGGDAGKFKAFLVRSNLETEMAQLESVARKIQAQADIDNAKHQAEALANADAMQKKRAEIDAL